MPKPSSQLRLFTVKTLFAHTIAPNESKAHRLERIAAQMRRRYCGLDFRERSRRAWITRRARALQEALPFDC